MSELNRTNHGIGAAGLTRVTRLARLARGALAGRRGRCVAGSPDGGIA